MVCVAVPRIRPLFKTRILSGRRLPAFLPRSCSSRNETPRTVFVRQHDDAYYSSCHQRTSGPDTLLLHSVLGTHAFRCTSHTSSRYGVPQRERSFRNRRSTTFGYVYAVLSSSQTGIGIGWIFVHVQSSEKRFVATVFQKC